MMTRKPRQLVAYPSVEEGVFEVVVVLAEDGSMWRLPKPAENTVWLRLPDLPPDNEESVQKWPRLTLPLDEPFRRA